MSTLLRPPVLAVDFSSAQTIEYTTSNSSTSPNVLSSTGGTALSVVNTTIGANGMNFKSISANGGNHGIVLTSTSGNLTVTGDGTGRPTARAVRFKTSPAEFSVTIPSG